MKMIAFPFSIVAFLVILALFGAFAFMSPMHHEMGCPFMAGEMALCATSTLDHLRHWQSAFASTLTNFISVIGLMLMLAVVGSAHRAARLSRVRMRVRLRDHLSRRPTLMQELFSDGIIHRKEPLGVVVCV